MYQMKDVNCKNTEAQEAMLHKKDEEKLFSLDTLLNLSETIATMTIGAGFLLLVAACLSAL